MPSLGAEMEEGTLLEWLVQPGQRVERGDIVAVVDTDKAAIEVETFVAGVVEELLVEPGTKLPVGTALARIRADADAAESAATEPPAARPATPSPVESPAARHAGRRHEAVPAPLEGPAARHAARLLAAGPPPATTPRPPERGAPPPQRTPIPARGVRASPLARRLAAERGVDLAALTGSGPGGAITEADVEAATAAAATSAGGDRSEAPRRAIAAAMERSKREIPHYYLASWVDMSAAATWLEGTNRRRRARDRVVYSALVLRAVALAARDVPQLNGYWKDGRFDGSEAVHVGMVVSLPRGGVLVPALLDADQMPLEQLMPALRHLVRRARRGRLRGSELSSGTITLTSLGEGAVEAVYGVIYPPQVALVGCGALVERPWAEEGVVGARAQICLTLSTDHRASDGRGGARFLRRVGELLRTPDEL